MAVNYNLKYLNNIMYNYTTPLKAILSLEQAYMNNDLDAIIASKDFMAEAKLILAKREDYDINDEALIAETAKLLQLLLRESILKNGFPNFTGVERDYSEIYHVGSNIYTVIEEIFYPDGTFFVNKIFLTVNNDVWKVAMVEE